MAHHLPQITDFCVGAHGLEHIHQLGAADVAALVAVNGFEAVMGLVEVA